MKHHTIHQAIRLAILLLAAGVLAVRAGENQIQNASFEEHPGMLQAAKWQSDGLEGFGTFADHAHIGQYAYKTWWQPAIWQDLKTRPGESWTVRAWFMNAPAAGEDKPLSGDSIGRIRLEFKNDSLETLAAVHSREINSETPTGKWIELTATGMTPEGCTLLRVVINRVESAGGGVFYVDDVEAKR